MPKTIDILIDDIRTDGGTQPREAIDADYIASLVEAINGDAELPPADVFHDGKSYWLADGFHRREAWRQFGAERMACIVHQGTQQDAQWFSYGANRQHDAAGLRRTNADKQRAVQAALRHPKADTESNVKIADHIGVGEAMVRRYRSIVEDSTSLETKSTHRTGSDGRTINVANIGKAIRKPQPVPPPSPGAVTHTEVIDKSTGEVIEDAEIVRTTLKAETPQPRGIGLDRAYEAIAILKTIPPKDGLRNEALDRVVQWCQHNR